MSRLNEVYKFGTKLLLAGTFATVAGDAARAQAQEPTLPEPNPISLPAQNIESQGLETVDSQSIVNLAELVGISEQFPANGELTSTNGELTFRFSQSVLNEYNVSEVISPPQVMDHVYQGILDLSSGWGDEPIIAGQELHLQVPFNINRQEINGGGDEIRGVFSGKITQSIVSTETFDALLIQVNSLTDEQRRQQNLIRFNHQVATDYESIGITALAQLTPEGELVILQKIPGVLKRRWGENLPVLFIMHTAVDAASLLGQAYAQAQGNTRGITVNFDRLYFESGVDPQNLTLDTTKFEIVFAS